MSTRRLRTARALATAALAVGLVGPAAAAAQVAVDSEAAQQLASGTPAWLRARLDGRLDGRTRAAVGRVVDSAYAAGIPAEPLVDKALEGASKRASGDAILRAVRQLAADLATARQALGTNSLVGELAGGAAALRAGVDADALHRLRADRPGQPLVVALGVLTDLIARGVPADGAATTMLALSRLGAVDEQLVAFRRDVERDIGLGAPPAAALALRAGGPSFRAARLPSDGAAGLPPGTKRRP